LNVLKWGTGGINIDATRIRTDDDLTKRSKYLDKKSTFNASAKNRITIEQPQGRFPANLILDEEAGKLLDEQSGQSTSKKLDGSSFKVEDNGEYVSNVYGKYKAQNTIRGHNDKGGASRFFYCAKSSKRERNNFGEVLFELKKDTPKEIKVEIEKYLNTD
jgi:site-specific DNA-methyltransferase (adenine-specific)